MDDDSILGQVGHWVYAVGCILNTAVFVPLIVARMRGTLFARLEQQLFVLVGTAFAWTVADLFMSYLPTPMDPYNWQNRAWGLSLAILWTVYFPINALLAMQRYFLVTSVDDEHTRVHVCIVVAASVAFLIVFLVTVIVYPQVGGIVLDPIGLRIYMANLAILFVCSCTVTVVCYFLTYQASTRQLKEATTTSCSNNKSQDFILKRVQHKILASCCIMASTLIIFYAPSIFYLNAVAFNLFGMDEMDEGLAVVVNQVSNLVMGVDVMLAPVFAVCFSRDVQNAVWGMWRWRRKAG
ncbi:hypothetical protein HDU81_010056 [Chytriomyces hyalinus]|nr:hypothetical protein HDU81_010056 [Chytriomyces hyalinus]